jgi:hypothetical protein
MPASLYLGRTGSGKTYLLRSHVADLAAENPDSVILVCDHGEVAGKPSWRDLQGARVYHSIRDWWHEPCRLALFQGVPGRDVADLAVKVGWTIYVDDECDDVVSDGWKDSPLREIVKRGRHLTNVAGEVTHVQALLATHRPANLPTDCTGIFDRVYIGRLDAMNDCDRIAGEAWIPDCRNLAAVQTKLRPLAPDDVNAPGPRHFLTYP